MRWVGMLALGAMVVAGGCSGDDPTAPTVAQVAGSYDATTFTATTALGSENILSEGGSLTAVFASSGAVTGHVTVPTQSVDDDFTGTWTIDDAGMVEIHDVPADIFVEDLTFDVVGNTLVADETFSGVRIQVTLTKQQ